MSQQDSNERSTSFTHDYEQQPAPNGASWWSVLMQQITWQRAAVVLFYLLLVSGCIIALDKGALEAIARFADESGAFGIFCFFLLMVFIVQPYAYGYTATVVMIGFLYEWLGFAIVLAGAVSGSAIAFFAVRHFGSCGSSGTELPPKQALFLEKLNEATAERNFRSFAILVGCRFSPIPFGIVSTLLALTRVRFLDFIVSLMLGVSGEAPLAINLGILISRSRDLLGNKEEVFNGTDTSEEEALANVQFILSTVVSIIVFVLGGLYGRYIWKEISQQQENSLLSRVDRLISKVSNGRASLSMEPIDDLDLVTSTL